MELSKKKKSKFSLPTSINKTLEIWSEGHSTSSKMNYQSLKMGKVTFPATETFWQWCKGNMHKRQPLTGSNAISWGVVMPSSTTREVVSLCRAESQDESSDTMHNTTEPQMSLSSSLELSCFRKLSKTLRHYSI